MYLSIQSNLLSIIIPRNVIISTLPISLLSILSFNLTLSFIFIILNNKILVLSIFNDNLLIFSHIYNWSIPHCILFSSFEIDVSDKIKVVSSENKIGLKIKDILGRSFIYNTNKIGPN